MSRRIGVTLLVLAVLGGASGAFGRAASSFGGDGRVVTRFEVHPQKSGTIEDLVVADGQVALATEGRNAQPIQLALLKADGSPDRAFGGDGLVQPQLEPGRPFLDEPVRIALLGRGRGSSLLVAGAVEAGRHRNDLELRRYLADGRPDRHFGRHGVVESPANEAVALFPAPHGGFVLFANGGPGRTYNSTGVVARFGPHGRLAGSGPKKRLPPFQQVVSGPGEGFLAQTNARKSSLVRVDARGQVVDRSTPPVSEHSGFSLLGEDAEGRALGWLDGVLVRLRSDDRTVDTGFRAELPACGQGGRSVRPNRTLVEASGGILLVNHCGLARLGPDGAADPSFAGGGYLTDAADANRLALGTGDGVFFARWRGEKSLPAIGRVDRGGGLDPGFGDGGQVRLRLPAPRASHATGLVAVGGRLFATGTVLCPGKCRERYAVARYRARSGRLDRTFGKAGKALGASGLGSALAAASLPGGDVIVAGTTSEDGAPPNRERAVTLERFHASGRPDRRFGKGGAIVKQIAAGPGRSEALAVAAQDDGKIVVAALAGCRTAEICFTVARFRPNGLLDRSFAHRGVFRLKGGIEASAVAIADDGKIVASGGQEGFFITVRLTSQGRLDRSFGNRGVVIHRQRVSFKHLLDYSIGPKDVAVGPDGSVTVAGGSDAKTSHAIFERYLPDGRRDRGFGHGGWLLVQRLGVTAIAPTRCGIVAAGSMLSGGRERQMAVAGLDRSGRVYSPPRPLFPAGRRSTGDAVAVSGGRATVAGSRRAYSIGTEFALAAKPLGDLLPRC